MIKILQWGLVFLLIFTPVFKGAKEIGPLTFIQLFIIIATIFHLLSGRKTSAREEDRMRRSEARTLNYLLFCFLFILIASTFNSIYLYPSLSELFKIISYVLLYYLVFNLVKTADFKNKILNIIIFICTLIAIVGIWQHLQHQTSSVTFPNVNLAAGYLVAGIALALSKLLTDYKWRINYMKQNKYLVLHISYLVLTIIMLMALVYTGSRGGLLSFLVVFTFLSVVVFKKWGLIFVLVALILVSIFIPQDYVIRLLKLNWTDPYTFQRLAIWNSGLKAIKARPLLGWGLGTFGYIFYRYNFPVSGTIAQYAKVTRFTHNEFIQLGAEAGLIALFLFIGMLVVIFKKGVKDWRDSKDDSVKPDVSRRWLIIGPLAGSVGILTHGLVDFNLHLPAISILLVFFAAMIMNNRFIQENQPETPGVTVSKVIMPIIGLLIIGVLITMPYIAYLYGQRENYQKAVLFNPLYSPYYEALGKVYAQKFSASHDEKWENLSIKEFQKAIRLNPEYPYHYQNLANFYLSYTQNLDEAINNYQKAIQRAPYDASLYFNLGSIYFNEKKFIDAITMYLKTTGLEPNYLRAYYQLGRSYEEIGEQRRAITAYNNIINLLHRDLMSKITYIPSDYENRLWTLDTALVYNRLGLLYMRQNKTEEAIANFRKALKINPRYAEVYSNLGGVYYQMGLYALAASEIGKALRIEPNNKMFQKNFEEAWKKIMKE